MNFDVLDFPFEISVNFVRYLRNGSDICRFARTSKAALEFVEKTCAHLCGEHRILPDEYPWRVCWCYLLLCVPRNHPEVRHLYELDGDVPARKSDGDVLLGLRLTHFYRRYCVFSGYDHFLWWFAERRIFVTLELFSLYHGWNVIIDGWNECRNENNGIFVRNFILELLEQLEQTFEHKLVFDLISKHGISAHRISVAWIREHPTEAIDFVSCSS